LCKDPLLTRATLFNEGVFVPVAYTSRTLDFVIKQGFEP
jgi:hypothetical protein